jgi:hypothetical protein
MAAGFPNLFILAGPGSPSIRVNVMVAIEQHVEWIADLIAEVEQNGIDTVEATVEAEQAWTKHVADTANGTLLVRDDTQYVGANVPGKPRTYLAYIGGLDRYRQICDDVAEAGYEGFLFTRDGRELNSSNGRTWRVPETRQSVGNSVI